MSARVKVWDLPTRLFHWTLTLLVGVSWWSGAVGGVAFNVHRWSGCAVLSLVLFRLAWGIAGGEHARFKSFLHGPRRVLAAAKALLSPSALTTAGHNPLGGWMVMALLVALAVQATTGLFANDDIMNEGPLAAHVSAALSERLSTVHEVNFWILMALIALHVLAIVYHRLRKGERLVVAMLSGYRALPPGTGAAYEVSLWRAVMLLALSAGIVALVVNL